MSNFLINKAVKKSNLEHLQKLLKNGEDINIKNEVELTPLHVAYLNLCNKEIFECLLSYNANVNAKDSNISTPLYFVISRNL